MRERDQRLQGRQPDGWVSSAALDPCFETRRPFGELHLSYMILLTLISKYHFNSRIGVFVDQQ